MKLRDLLTLFVLLSFYCQTLNAKTYSMSPVKITRADTAEIKIVLDGKLEESIWRNLPAQDDMVVVQPDTLEDAPLETRSYFFYTDKGLYVGVWNEQDPDLLISRLSSRDKFISRDSISITIDPSGQGLYGYWFSVSLGGTLGDGTVIPERQYSNQWDGPWQGASAEHEEGWSAEFFIPWSMMTMPNASNNTRTMGYSISRSVAYKNERWAFPPLPRTEKVFLSKLPKIQLDSINPKQQFTFYPYASSSYNNVSEDDPGNFKAGFDVFWRPNTNTQLTATVNPDFGNVESDNVVVNLSSFETFFPEKRAFFLEGQEIFVTTPRANGRHGVPTTIVNTRRIGSRPKSTDIPGFELPAIEANQPSELYGAGKVTGQQGDLRYGVLAAFEDDTELNGKLDGADFSTVQDGRNFAVARFLYEDTSRGSRHSVGWISTLVAHPEEDAVVHGVDAHYLSRDGRWNTDAQMMFSNVDGATGNGAFVDLSYTPKRGTTHDFSFDYFDDELDINDFGFLRRNDKISARYRYNLNESNLKKLKSRYTGIGVGYARNSEGKMIGGGLSFNQDLEFSDNSTLFYRLNYSPGRVEDRDSLGNGNYRIQRRWNPGIKYRTDQSRNLSLGAGIFYSDEDIRGGRTFEYELEAAWRPTDRFSLLASVSYADKKGWLLHDSDRDFTAFNADVWRPKIEMNVFFSAKQQFRVTAQWAGIKAEEDGRWEVPIGDGSLDPILIGPGDSPRDFSISRLTFQARYRWEIAPLSDLFVVYTRGSNLSSMPEEDFGDLFSRAWTDRVVDVFIIKLRYRLGG
ncbi:MAG: DUF5916 domain-containing protein [bacterium]